MNNELKDILTKLSEGNISLDEAMLKIRTKPFEDIDFAKIDLHRKARQGFAEVIYGEGKTSAQIIKIINSMQSNNEQLIMVTRLNTEKTEEIKRILPLDYYDSARIGIIGALPQPDGMEKLRL
jgi:NCAIR mutase (PurE)-related proteins